MVSAIHKAAVVLLCLLTGCANSFQVSVYTGGTTYEVSTGQASRPSSAGQSSFVASSDTSSGSTAANLPSSLILGGSALLLAVAGGIITTVYQGNANAKARLDAEEFRKLHPAQVPTVPVQERALPATPPPPAELLPPAPELTPPPPPPQTRREPTLDAMVMARAWLLANKLQLLQDLALGAGPAIDDLAGIAKIPDSHRGHFGRVLQRNRANFSIDPDLSPQQAALVMSRVGELVLGDPLLRPDGLRAAR